MACLGLTSLVAAGSAQPAHATTGINSEINYQARLLNSAGATVPDGSYNLEFNIYAGGNGCVGGGSSPCGAGAPLWTEDWLNNNSQGVQVTNGYFSVMLGAGSDSAALSTLNFNQTPLWLSIAVGGTNPSCATYSACGGDTEMLPFTQFAAAPYAFDAAQVGGINASSLAVLSPSGQQTGTLNVSGNITSGASLIASAATLSGPSALTLGSTSNAAAIIFQDGTSNNRAVTVTTAGLSASYSLTLPTTGPSTAQCLQSGASTASQLVFGSCTTGNTLQTAYNNSAAGQQIVLNSSEGGLAVQDNATPIGGNLLAVQSNGGGTTYFSVAATGIANASTGYDIAGSPICTGSGCVVAATSGIQNGTSPQTANFNITGNGTIGGNLAVAGTATLQNATNSTTAFQVNNAPGTDNSDNLLGVSTVYNANNLVTNGSFEQDLNGWSAEGTNASINPITGVGAPFGSGAMEISTTGTPSANAGAKFPVTMVSGDLYSLSFYAKVASGTFTTMSFGRSDNGSTNTTCSTTSNPNTTDWLRFTCTFTPSAQSGSPYVFIGQNDTAANHDWYIDGVSLETLTPSGQSISTSFYKEGNLDLSGLALSNVLIQPTANTNATLMVASVTGLNGLTVNTDANNITTSFAATFSSSVLESDTGTAAFTIRNNTTANPLIKADTTTIDNIDTNGGLESSSSAATGYASNGTLGTGGSVALDTTADNAYGGSNTLKVITGASGVTANSGAKYSMTTATFPINSSPGYSLSFYAKLPAGSAPFTTLVAGYAQNGSTNTTCTLNSNTVTTYWQRYTCSFTTSASSGTPYVFFGQSDASVAHTYYIDDVQVFSAAAPVIYREGGLQFNGVITSATTLQNTSDSANAFQIQNAGSTTTLLNVDTGSTKVSVSGQLAVTGGLSTAGLSTPAAPTVTPTCTGSCSASYSYAVAAVNANGTTTPASTATATGSTQNATLSSTNFNTVTWAAVAGASSYNIYRTASGGTPSSTGLIGSVLTSNTLSFADTGIAGTTAAPTVDNSGQFKATGTALFQNATDSANSFQIQNHAGTTTLLNADTTGSGALTIGAATSTFNGTLTVSVAGNALVLSAAPTASATNSLLDLGSSIASGSTLGTFIGINAANGYTGDLVNLEVNGASKFDITAAGDIRQGNATYIYNTGANTPSIYSTAATMTTNDLLLERFVVISAGGFVLTTPTAAAIVAAIPHATIGDTFVWNISNGAGTGDTVAGGTGVTFTDPAKIQANSSSAFACVLNNVTGGSQAVTCY